MNRSFEGISRQRYSATPALAAQRSPFDLSPRQPKGTRTTQQHLQVRLILVLVAQRRYSDHALRILPAGVLGCQHRQSASWACFEQNGITQLPQLL